MKPQEELEVLIRAKYPILYVITFEEERVVEALESIASELKRPFHTWSLTQGTKVGLEESPYVPKTRLSAELEVLAEIYSKNEPAIYCLKDYHVYLNDSRVIRLLRELAHRLKSRSQTLILTAPVLRLPTELEKDITVLDFGLPDDEEIAMVVESAVSAIRNNPNVDGRLDPQEYEKIVKSCMGLTLNEVESVLARSLVEKKKLSVDVILEQKKQIVRKTGLLEYYAAEDNFKNVGGMEHLKEWLIKRRESFTDKAREYGLPAPKGVLLLGVQGCGKSLVAKAIASEWNLPMLRLDVGRIFGSLVGQSEENIRRAIKVAESVAPCILWADELEKGFAGTQSSAVSDSGTTARVFATFLTWMQEKTSPVFLVATSNDVSQLPPELLRKGRFDEIFFIDLPDFEEREEIFRIHLRKRKRNPENFDIKKLAEATKGFSGAEIEQIVVSALFSAFYEHRELTQEDMLKEAEHMVPLSVMMSEDIQTLRDWARLRARPASRKDEPLETERVVEF
ncbi:MAG TPA: AAA family ATPase [Fimbriimonadales bacterium]|nr:AAA family ATPase [Fimbriimonadales bacterium]